MITFLTAQPAFNDALLRRVAVQMSQLGFFFSPTCQKKYKDYKYQRAAGKKIEGGLAVLFLSLEPRQPTAY